MDTQGQYPLAAYATLRLPTPLTIAGWGTEHGCGSTEASAEAGAGIYEGAEGEPSFVDSQILVTLQVSRLFHQQFPFARLVLWGSRKRYRQGGAVWCGINLLLVTSAAEADDVGLC